MKTNAKQTPAANTAVVADTPTTVETPTVAKESGTTGQARALRQDTKIAGRTHAAVAANTVAASVLVLALDGLAKSQDDSVRASARGTMLVAPGAYIIGLGTTTPTAKAPQHQLALAAFSKVMGDADPKTTGADLHAVQVEYERLGGTDLSIFTGRTRLFTNSSKSAKVSGVAQAPLTVYNAPMPPKAEGTPAKEEGEGEGGEQQPAE